MRHHLVFIFCLLLMNSATHAELIGYWPFDGNADAVVGANGIEMNGPLFALSLIHI